MARSYAHNPGRDVRGGRGKGSYPKGGRPSGGKAPHRQGGPRQGTGSYRHQGAHRQPVRNTSTPRLDTLIEGRRAVAEALDAELPLRSALVMDGEGDSGLEALVDRLAAAGVTIERVPRSQLDRLSSHGAHQGIVVRTQPFAYSSVRQIIERAGDGPALVVLLDHVTDEGNFGAIVRSAEVVGAAGVIIANARAAAVGVGAYKTSAGAVLHLPIAQVPNLVQAMKELKEAGFWCCAATEHAEQDVWSAPLDGRICLVMGSEGSGVSHLVRQSCDFECRLPQRGHVESLNVAQATTVMCYEWLRRQQAAGER